MATLTINTGWNYNIAYLKDDNTLASASTEGESGLEYEVKKGTIVGISLGYNGFSGSLTELVGCEQVDISDYALEAGILITEDEASFSAVE